jgi:hypothetical protein
MAKAIKSDLQKVLKLIVASAEKRLTHLPPKQAAVVRRKIRRIASEIAAQGSRKTAKSPRPRARSDAPRPR